MGKSIAELGQFLVAEHGDKEFYETLAGMKHESEVSAVQALLMSAWKLLAEDSTEANAMAQRYAATMLKKKSLAGNAVKVSAKTDVVKAAVTEIHTLNLLTNDASCILPILKTCPGLTLPGILSFAYAQLRKALLVKYQSSLSQADLAQLMAYVDGTIDAKIQARLTGFRAKVFAAAYQAALKELGLPEPSSEPVPTQGPVPSTPAGKTSAKSAKPKAGEALVDVSEIGARIPKGCPATPVAGKYISLLSPAVYKMMHKFEKSELAAWKKMGLTMPTKAAARNYLIAIASQLQPGVAGAAVWTVQTEQDTFVFIETATGVAIRTQAEIDHAVAQ